MSEKKGFLKKVGGLSVVTTISRIMGLVREMARAQFLGTSFYSDAFSLAFSLPNLFRRLTAEGAMSNAFIPVFCEVREQEGIRRALSYAKNFFWALALISSFIVLLFTWQAEFLVSYVFAAGYTGEALESTVFLSRLMFAYMVLISLSAILQGILNSFSVFWVSAATPILLNLAIIGAAYGLDGYFDNPATPFAIGVIVGGAIQLLFQIPYTHKLGFRLFGKIDLKDDRIKESMHLMGPTLFGAGIYQINIVISNLIATTLSEGAVSSLTYSNRLLELVLGVFVISITTVILPSLSKHFSQKDHEAAKVKLQDNLSLIALVTLPVTAVTYVLADEIVAVLFLRGEFNQTSLIMTAGALRMHILGLFFIGANRLCLTAYQASRQIKLTIRLSVVVMLANIVGCYGLAVFMGHEGIALASSLSQALNLLLLILLMPKLDLHRFVDSHLFAGLIRHVLLALFLWLILHEAKLLLLPFGYGYFVNLVILSLFSVVAFVLPALLFKPPEIKQLLQMFQNRRRRL